MLFDLKWQLMKLASLAVKPPPLFSFPVGDAVVDSDGHSLLGPALVPGSDLAFEPCAPALPFEGCDHYALTFGGNEVVIGIRDGRVQSVFYDYEIYRESGPRRMAKLRYLLEEHSTSDSDRLVESTDNGSAVLFRSENRSQLGVYGYLADTFLVYSSSAKPIRRRPTPKTR